MRLFDEADTNHDGVVTKEELIALARSLRRKCRRGAGAVGRAGDLVEGDPVGLTGRRMEGQVEVDRAAEVDLGRHRNRDRFCRDGFRMS